MHNELIERVRAQLAQLKDNPSQKAVEQQVIQSANQQGGFVEYIIDVSEITVAPNGTFQKDVQGYGIYFCEEGSTPGVTLDVFFGQNDATGLRNFRAGDVYTARFSKLILRQQASEISTLANQNGQTTNYVRGKVRILVIQNPQFTYASLRSGDRNYPMIQRLYSPLASNVTQVAQTTSQDSEEFFGSLPATMLALDINGARGMRFTIAIIGGVPDDGGGQLILFWQPPDTSDWFFYAAATGQKGEFVDGNIALPIEAAQYATPDLPVHCAAGRIWAAAIIPAVQSIDVLNASLVAYYPYIADGTDFTGNGNTATLNGPGLTLLADFLGGGVERTSGGSITYPAGLINGAGDFSVFFWVKNFGLGPPRIMFGIGLTQGFQVGSTTIGFTTVSGGSKLTAFAPAAMAWSMIAWTYNAGTQTLKAYGNGVLLQTWTAVDLSSFVDPDTGISAGTNELGLAAHGIYSREVPDDQILGLYNEGNGQPYEEGVGFNPGETIPAYLPINLTGYAWK